LHATVLWRDGAQPVLLRLLRMLFCSDVYNQLFASSIISVIIFNICTACR
jgi:hypothetical protein